jgi:hypothetical protein
VDKRVVASLRESDTKEKVEDTFKTFNISKTEDKIKYLDKAMYDPQVFSSR